MLLKIAIVFALLCVPAGAARAAEEKEWYPFMQNKGWYPFEGQSGSSGASGEQEKPLVQPSTQPPSISSQSGTGATPQNNLQPQQSFWAKQ